MSSPTGHSTSLRPQDQEIGMFNSGPTDSELQNGEKVGRDCISMTRPNLLEIWRLKIHPSANKG